MINRIKSWMQGSHYRAKKSHCECWLRFFVVQKRSLSCLVISNSHPMSLTFFCHVSFMKMLISCLLKSSVFIRYFESDIFVKSNPFRFKETFISFNNKWKWWHLKGDTIHSCWPKLLLTKQTFDLYFLISVTKNLSSHILYTNKCIHICEGWPYKWWMI